MSGTGTTSVAAGATMNVTGYLSLAGRTLVNAGAATVSGNQFSMSNGATINNQTGADYDDRKYRADQRDGDGVECVQQRGHARPVWSDRRGGLQRRRVQQQRVGPGAECGARPRGQRRLHRLVRSRRRRRPSDSAPAGTAVLTRWNPPRESAARARSPSMAAPST